MSRRGVALVLVLGLLWAAFPAAAGGGTASNVLRDGPRYAYHLRLVRVAGNSDYHGAALGCGRTCGRPIVVPAEEAWGSPAQLEGLARALGGERADAVTGFIVLAGPDGEAHFGGTVYPGEAAVGLEFSARVPATPDGPHDLHLVITPAAEGEGAAGGGNALDGGGAAGGEPLVEARVLSASERTIAFAAPSPVAGEWLVLAVTTLDPAAAEARVTAGAPAAEVEGSVTPPRLIVKVPPQYPPRAKSLGRQGKVVISAVVDVEGRVRAPMILQVDPGIEDLAASAVETVEQWRYEPATRDGAPVAVYFTIIVEFQLR